MAVPTKLFLLNPSHSSLFPISSLVPKTPSLSLSSRAPQTHIPLSSLSPPSYGPSLSKGQTPKPLEPQDPETPPVFDEGGFVRVFELAAIRVPSRDCSSLEARLRGHLLNWPRIRNVARVPGDDFDSVEIAGLVAVEEGGLVQGRRERPSPVLARDEAARKFDSRGFVGFRNLARLSRPMRRRRKGKLKKNAAAAAAEEERVGRRGFAVVEVIGEDGDDGELRGLLGEEFAGPGKWRGPTRLLLLDEGCSTKCLNELPEAIKVVLNENSSANGYPAHELVKCRLTLFYEYWQMNEVLEAMLPKGMIIPSSFETVGHIAHLNLRNEHLPYKKLIAKVVLDKNRPKIQTVVNKIDAIHNDYRTMELEILEGNRSLVTTVVENGLRFCFDLALVYWNSRLATERQRLLSGFKRNDVVCDVFCGVGPIAIAAARIVKRVYANDLNPHAIEYLERNSVLNKIERNIKIFNMDGRRFIIAMFQSDKATSITQVVMNLPNEAAEFLDSFRGVLRWRSEEKESVLLPTIHVYGFSKARDPEFDFHERIRIGLSEAAVDVEMHRVRLVAPGKWMLCASFVLPRSVAFAKSMLKM